MTPPKPLAERFRVQAGTLFWDRFMDRFIRLGGWGVVLAVSLIFVFILIQILPLFRGASVKSLGTFTIPHEKKILAFGIDDYGSRPFTFDEAGQLKFHDLESDTNGAVTILVDPPALPKDFLPSSALYRQDNQTLIVGSRDGRFATLEIKYSSTRDANGKRVTTQEVVPGPVLRIGKQGSTIHQVSYGDGGSVKLAAVIQDGKSGPEVHLMSFTQERSIMGEGEIRAGEEWILSNLPGRPERLLVKKQGDGVAVVCHEGSVAYFQIGEQGPELFQVFQPFAKKNDPRVSSADFLFGDVTLVFSHVDGTQTGWSLFAREDLGNRRLFAHTKDFPNLASRTVGFGKSIRNKAFVVSGKDFVSLRYGTTENVRWQGPTEGTAAFVLLGGKYDRILSLEENGRMRSWELRDPHPEISFRTFFGKIWYEGAPAPKYEWQSTGGNDDFEPKLSFIPLIIGTLKGTFYAMIFAVPVALLAAIYVSQFLRPDWKVFIKPTMEIMASLPSVVLGFLAALFVAPLLETRIPSLLLVAVLIPLTALGFGSFWANLPIRIRRRIRPGWEFLAFVPLFLVVGWIGWKLGPVLERWVFTIPDPSGGAPIADFRQWVPAVLGLKFEQRNSLVIGFIMGFAVMPILFTIAEDALSNVPNSLRSGALALGASRWQTALKVIVPTAAAGIFSALMIAFGRAVGETMIVVMATGNTPILDFNVFNGMRTLSANIAVELPEAPEHGTLYRSLFFGAMLLFLFTFLLNTVAEVLRQRLRDRYKSV